MKISNRVSGVINALASIISQLPLDERVAALNAARLALHAVSPFKAEPVDCVEWVLADSVHANDYNPNSVAPPEMKLLELSILEDGYTQPIVTFDDAGSSEVVDGFHRNRVGKECAEVKSRILGYLPIVRINPDRGDRSDRMASTIRHNRARGKHRVEAMTDIVVELKRRNWSDEKIAKNLGMDPDEVLRLAQISGIAEMFADKEFSASWDLDDVLPESIDGVELE
jgi:ParB-like chromosome segregation protein Spo0J